MTGGVLLFLTMRALHVVLAAAWFGALLFMTLYLGPSVDEAGPAGGQLMNIMVRRGVPKYMASLGGLTVVVGFYLFWRLTGDPAFAGSHRGIAYSVGALTGIIGLILGGSMIGGSVKKLSALGPKAASMPEGAERAALMATMAALRSRVALFSKIVSALLFISMVTMALGHLI
jgi:uncharacterized membrane protein